MYAYFYMYNIHTNRHACTGAFMNTEKHVDVQIYLYKPFYRKTKKITWQSSTSEGYQMWQNHRNKYQYTEDIHITDINTLSLTKLMKKAMPSSA